MRKQGKEPVQANRHEKVNFCGFVDATVIFLGVVLVSTN